MSLADLRRTSLGALALSLALMLFTASAAPAAPSGAPMRPLITGVSDVFDNDVAAFANAQKAGVQRVQTLVRWPRIAPDARPANWNPADPADPNYDWEAMDLWVIRAIQSGLTPVLMIYGAPLWSQRCPEQMKEPDAPCNPDPADLAAFTTAAVRRYSGTFGGLPRIRYWQGFNEPNLSLFFTPQFEGDRPVSPDLYRVLINTFYGAVKAVDPTNLVLAAGLGPIAVPKYTIGPMRFTRMLLCMKGGRPPSPLPGDCGGGVHFDIFDIHPYTTGGPTHTGGRNDVQLGDLGKLKELLKAADRAGRIKGAFKRTPLWITEFAWDTNPPDPGGLQMKIAARWAAEALYRAWSAGITDFFWFSLRDFPANPSLPFSQTLQTGLYFRAPDIAQDQPKETMYAFRFPFVAFPREQGLFFWGRTPTSARGKVQIQVLKGGKWRPAAGVRAGAGGMFSGVIPLGYGRNKKGSVRAHYAGESSVPFSMRPVRDFRVSPFG
jgi:hypothetical protein